METFGCRAIPQDPIFVVSITGSHEIRTELKFQNVFELRFINYSFVYFKSLVPRIIWFQKHRKLLGKVMTIFRSLFALAIVAVFGLTAVADTVTTGFDTSDGFITGPVNGASPAAGAFNPVTVQSASGFFAATFIGGQQQQGFDFPSYQAGGTGYFFVNTGPGAATFTGSSGNTITGGANNGDQTGSIVFNNLGASTVSFFAADRANGAASTLDIFDLNGALLLDDFSIPSGNVADQFFSFDAASLGGNIGSITFDLPGPAANPPYVLAIDTFSATAAIPEPSSAALIGGSLLFAGLFRRRRRTLDK